MILSERRQAWYAPILGMSVALTLLRLGLLAHLLDIPNFALLSGGLLVASTFSMLSCLGLYIVLLRDLPALIVQRRERRGALLLTQCIAAAIVCAAVAMALTPLLAPMAALPAAAFLLGIWYGLSQQIFLVLNTDCRSRGELIHFAKENLLRSLMVLVTGMSIAWITGSAWWILLLEGTVSMLLVLHSGRKLLNRTMLRGRLLVHLALRRWQRLPWRSALVLLLNSFLGFLVLSADRWLAASQVNAEGFARYSFIGVVLVCAMALQAIIGSAVFPALARKKGTDGPKATLSACARYSLVLLLASAIAAVPLWWLVSSAISRWFPLYDHSDLLLSLLLAVAVVRVSDFWSTHLIVVGRENLLLILNALAAVGGTALWWMILRPLDHSIPLSAESVASFALCLSAASYILTATAAVFSTSQWKDLSGPPKIKESRTR